MNALAMLPGFLAMLPPELRQAFAGILELAAIARDTGPPLMAPEVRERIATLAAVHGIPPALLCALTAAGVPAVPAGTTDTGSIIMRAADEDPARACMIAGAFLFYLFRDMDPARAREMAVLIRG